MSQLPLRSAISAAYPNPSNAEARVGFGKVWDVVNETTEAPEIDLASASTCDIGSQISRKLRITGTTTITSFGTAYTGPILLRMAGALTLTHNSTTLRCPGATNMATAAGDVLIAWPTATTSGTTNGWQVARLAGAGGDVASTTNRGYVELATDAEAQAGTDAARCITPDNLGATVLGIGQTWQNLTASRALGTTYTNSTGRPIIVTVSATSSANSIIQLATSSQFFYGSSALSPGEYTSVYTLILAGATYAVTVSAGTGAIVANGWHELR